MKPIVTYRGTVYPWQCDHVGHMNVMWYVGKFDEASWHLMAAVGITPTYMREHMRGMAGVQQNITYKRELFAGNIVEIYSHLVSIADRKLVWVHEMRDAESDEVCAICELTAVYIDRTARRATPFPAEIRERAREMLDSP
ncbi:MAG: acyl-CoA thioesterase [Candidatus Eremiobacteraeota bacterium]|nr:acyl-CoA thioesterase [Candidatus Eremiobacteraeota bacterium]